jgi:hypothetical protein
MRDKDWTGNNSSVFSTMGATNHSDYKRANDDYYATHPSAVEALLAKEKFYPAIWECACGAGHIAEVLIKHGYKVTGTDIADRGYGRGGIDFLSVQGTFDLDIVTNPPYKYALDFVTHALGVVGDGHRVAMLLRLQFLEGKTRRAFFDKYPPQTVYVSSARILCARNGDFDAVTKNGSAIAFAWFVWQKGATDRPTIDWI